MATKVRMPVAAGMVYGNPTPLVRTVGDSHIVSHQGVCREINLSNTFTAIVLQCMPSVIEPWITGVAENWSKYRWRKLRFFWVPFAPTTTQGAVHMGLQYDNIDSTPTSVSQIAALQSYSGGPIWTGSECSQVLNNPKAIPPPGCVSVDLDVNRLQNPWYPYIEQASFTAQAGISLATANLFSPARLIFATSNGTAASPGTPVGNLMVNYEIELIEPCAAANNL